MNLEILDSCDEIIVALGSKEEALKVSNLLKKKLIKCPISTVYDEKYSWQYQKIHRLYMLENNSVFSKKGWFLSNQTQESIDNEKNPLPWYTYASIDFLKSRVNKQMKVFEFGCGNSPYWWSERVQSVNAVEHDKEWYTKVISNIPSNVQVSLCEDRQSYISEIANGKGSFNIICKDGIHRKESVEQALPFLKKKGVIIFDNSDRQRLFGDGMQYLTNEGFKKIEFYGMGAINDYEWETSVFYRPDNILGI
ncbi:hypothetical protein [Lysinibacillus sp. NPDC096212]|uniref:hypothetical protein n=1 Tax=Lysinibacillus sp. NPDC096212 TaxID=3364135 RepID=UPI0037FCD612